MSIKRILNIMKQFETKGQLNEATNDGESYSNFWETERNNIKNEMWDSIEKARTKDSSAYADITKRHVSLLVDVFGTKFGPQMDPNLAKNILKNPKRLMGKLNDFFSGVEDNENPTGLTKFNDEVQKQIVKPEVQEYLNGETLTQDMLVKMFNDERKSRVEYMNKFADFIKKRHVWRKKLDKRNLKGKEVEFYIPAPMKKIGRGEVVVSFSYATDQDIQNLNSTFENLGIVDVDDAKRQLSNYHFIKTMDGDFLILSNINIVPLGITDGVTPDEVEGATGQDMVDYFKRPAIEFYNNGKLKRVNGDVSKDLLKFVTLGGQSDYYSKEMQNIYSQMGLSSSNSNSGREFINVRMTPNSKVSMVVELLATIYNTNIYFDGKKTVVSASHTTNRMKPIDNKVFTIVTNNQHFIQQVFINTKEVDDSLLTKLESLADNKENEFLIIK